MALNYIFNMKPFKDLPKEKQKVLQKHFRSLTPQVLYSIFVSYRHDVQKSYFDTLKFDLQELYSNLERKEYQHRHEMFFDEYKKGERVTIPVSSFCVDINEQYHRFNLGLIPNTIGHRNLTTLTFKTTTQQQIICDVRFESLTNQYLFASFQGWFNLTFTPELIHHSNIYIFAKNDFQIDPINVVHS